MAVASDHADTAKVCTHWKFVEIGRSYVISVTDILDLERVAHEATCNGFPAEIPRAIREVERECAGRRTPPQNFSTRRILFTIAIAGIAILLGSLVFQSSPDDISQS